MQIWRHEISCVALTENSRDNNKYTYFVAIMQQIAVVALKVRAPVLKFHLFRSQSPVTVSENNL